MGLTTNGAEIIADRLYGIGTPFDNVNAYIGVGNSSVAFSVNQSDLQGGSTFRGGMDSGYPIHSAGTSSIEFRHTFTGSEANFEWDEWAVFNNNSGGTMLNRFVEDNGRKVDEQTWEYTVTVIIQE